MGFSCGIVGLPNVGKSTLFNALTQTASAAAANFPFCTIEPNTGIVPVPDNRMDTLCGIVSPEKSIPTSMEFVDIAGLVAGAHEGEGLGNQFLANIREVSAIAHVVRCFEDDDITHVDGGVDPLRDIETIETELMLADLASLDKQISGIQKKVKSGDKTQAPLLAIMERAHASLSDGKAARTVELSAEKAPLMTSLNLLTTKPLLYIANVAEGDLPDGNAYSAKVQQHATAQGAQCVVVCAAIEAELVGLEDAERDEYLSALGLEEPGLHRVIRAGYALLDLITFFTAGKKEVRAWTVRRGSTAPQAAGRIHTDFERGFIRAETVSYDDYTGLGGENAARDAGKLRQEGKSYIVQDGDVLHFKFNV